MLQHGASALRRLAAGMVFGSSLRENVAKNFQRSARLVLGGCSIIPMTAQSSQKAKTP